MRPSRYPRFRFGSAVSVDDERKKRYYMIFTYDTAAARRDTSAICIRIFRDKKNKSKLLLRDSDGRAIRL